MAVGFRRTLTTLASPKSMAPSFLLDCARPKKLSYARVRSTSLPVRLHPLAAALHESARALLAWADAPAQTGPAWVADGAGRAGRVLSGLADLLHHPQARDALRRHPWTTEQLLDDLLLLADLHGCFRESLVALTQLLAETHAALRRRDGARLAAALRAQRRSAREVSRLASSARDLSHRAAPDDDSDEATLADAFAAATAAVAAASAAVFAGVSAASAESAASAAPSPRTPTPYSPARTPGSPMWLVTDLLRRRRTVSFEDSCGEEEEERKAAMGRVRGLEACVDAAESGCQEVYRALVNARVSLLNLLTPTF
ncbi:hypothetical protein Zm00014a_021824 [Zea mays]|jgi:hypothetical protein|uniref:DUF241 domain protein n=2 Tax=Zea mays TaxID=4577 RepID=A0A8J8YIU2_MAIZE|nr:DUF241 domain protein [Zea mays]PWZ57730.1 hypothetical protein Zm00014a_021824 [Zea mays]|eukprot:XP_008658063.1 uncharacterized protein LOC103637610 [Zea mays]